MAIFSKAARVDRVLTLDRNARACAHRSLTDRSAICKRKRFFVHSVDMRGEDCWDWKVTLAANDIRTLLLEVRERDWERPQSRPGVQSLLVVRSLANNNTTDGEKRDGES